jgi:predicted nuclease of restriction endonuclease-like RecB superfamily
MLKLTHVQARLSVHKGKAVVKQMSPDEPEDVQRATEIIELFRGALADRLTRDKLFARLDEYVGSRLDYREIDGLAKVICDSFAIFEQHVTPPPAPAAETPLEDSLLAGSQETDDEEAEPDATLTAFRLALWREVARPENFPFNNPNLTIALRPGVQSLRRAAAAYDADLLGRLMTSDRKVALMETVAATTGYALPQPIPHAEIGNLLFADLPGRHRIVALNDDLNIENLLNRYNVELLRGVLYLAPRVRIVVRDRYKDLFKYIKLFGLMHEIRPLLTNGEIATELDVSESDIAGYEIILEGAASPFLARTDRRYGVGFAKFLPALLLCEAEWELETELVFGWMSATGKGKVTKAAYKLGPQPHLRTHFRGSGEFDSLLEASFAAAFEKRFAPTAPEADPPPEPENDATEKPKRRKAKPKKPDPRAGWTLTREDRVIPVFDTVMIPDFSFVHTDGRRALLEIVGFWERGYLERKIAKLNRAGRSDFIVLVSERTRIGRQDFLVKGQEPPYQLVFFKGTPRLNTILDALERCAV